MNKKIDIYKSAGILIKDRKFLATRSKGKTFFVSPGGKVNPGEGAKEALVRELKEELNIDVRISDLSSFGTFFALAAGHDDKHIQMDVFLVGKWEGVIVPTSEVEEITWISSDVPARIELGSIFHQNVLPKLKDQNLID